MSDSFATPWIVARQVSLSMGYPRQEYWNGLPFPPPGDLPDLGIEHVSPSSPALTGGFFTTVPSGKHIVTIRILTIINNKVNICFPCPI